MLDVNLNSKLLLSVKNGCTTKKLQENIQCCTGLNIADYYLLYNGRIIAMNEELNNGKVHVILRTCGGKGGFGSMLRAIGAQIEKTTNREACRDLSGRRLRDINEEKRLKKWITQQAEREEEAAQRKQKKLERLCETPKYEFKDKNYDMERSQLPEMVENAVIQGMEASCSNVSVKRKHIEEQNNIKKKPKLWIDADVDDISSSDAGVSDGEDDENFTNNFTCKDGGDKRKTCNTSEPNNKLSSLNAKNNIEIENSGSSYDQYEENSKDCSNSEVTYDVSKILNSQEVKENFGESKSEKDVEIDNEENKPQNCNDKKDVKMIV